MNTNHLKKFAQAARRKLLTQVQARLEYVLKTDSAELREKQAQILKLKEEIQRSSKNQVIDKVAYTWFNRLMALRFMDVNDFQPLGLGVLSPKEGFTTPEIVEDAKQGHISEELRVDRQRIFDLLDGKVPSPNPQNEVFKLLLIAVCNHLHRILPFLFEEINDYTDLLLPDDLSSEYSIVHDILEGMQIEDCKEVEIIGWLYQFYVSEWNDELIRSKKVYKKNELAPASQLFTPRWIVQYMVDNTLGQLWTEMQPNTKITNELEFYIKPAYKEQLQTRTKKSIEEITFFEPCTGSGHILSYAFDVFYKMYEEEGYNPSEIPELIITKNLFGVDIDQRAAQLASFVLIMKGRQKNRRFLRTVESKNITPNIHFYQDFEFDEKFKNATALGSLIRVEPKDLNVLKLDKGTLFGERQELVNNLYQLLGQRYDVVVTNPPYISSSRMEGSLKQYVEATYSETKSDLFATFILRCLELCNEDGLTGYMTPFVWMFISSYEKLRTNLIDHHFINNLIQLEYSGFDGATVPICTFTLRNKVIPEGKGSYIRLSDFKGSQNQAPKTLEAIQNPSCGWFYTAYQKDYAKMPGSPIGYWIGEITLNVINKVKTLKTFSEARMGLATGNNSKFIRRWQEMSFVSIGLNFTNRIDANDSGIKWFPYAKGGKFRRWYGNNEYVVNWHLDGNELQNTMHPSGKRVWAHNFNLDNIFKPSITWSDITSGLLSARINNEGFLFDGSGTCAFFKEEKFRLPVLGLLNTSFVKDYSKILNPTLHFQPGDFRKLPFKNELINEEFVRTVKNCIVVSKFDWDSYEISWNYLSNWIANNNSNELEESFDLYKQYWTNKFFQLHKNEEELNRQFIEIYGLQEELTPDVPLEEITILQEELNRGSLKAQNTQLERDPATGLVTSYDDIQLSFDAQEVMAQFISYAVGCMFGRYSLDQEGLILANQGETLEDYLRILSESGKQASFLPDDDNIIPILDDEWFEDDIVNRFKEFLKVSFGEKYFDRNLEFLESCIGKDIRKYFLKDFYKDHISRYKKRPIYWMFSSPKGSFNVLIYLHRYTSDTLSQILSQYLNPFQEKIKAHVNHLDHIIETGNSTEQVRAQKEKEKLRVILLELQEYERDIFYPLASKRISIDLDDGVLVNYNKFGNAIKEVAGLNDKKTKTKVRGFDWIDVSEII
ncbi:BREX-1 system adenine-specific DNA-methyltransferase PglX [Peijinzhouia sedimentorum]